MGLGSIYLRLVVFLMVNAGKYIHQSHGSYGIVRVDHLISFFKVGKIIIWKHHYTVIPRMTLIELKNNKKTTYLRGSEIHESGQVSCFGSQAEAIGSKIQTNPWHLDYFPWRDPLKRKHGVLSSLIYSFIGSTSTTYIRICIFLLVKLQTNTDMDRYGIFWS